MSLGGILMLTLWTETNLTGGEIYVKCAMQGLGKTSLIVVFNGN